MSMYARKGLMRTTSAMPPTDWRKPPACRCSGANVSGMKKLAVTTMSRPKPASVQKIMRQFVRVSTSAPATGATIGARPPSACMTDITFASCGPRATSTMTARAVAAAIPPPMPCTIRATTSSQIVGDTEQATAPTVQMRPPTMIGTRRPRESDQGPPMSCPRPKPRKNVVRVRPTSDAVVPRSVVTTGNAGVYMSVANGGTAVWIAIVPISRAVTGTALGGRVSTWVMQALPTGWRGSPHSIGGVCEARGPRGVSADPSGTSDRL